MKLILSLSENRLFICSLTHIYKLTVDVPNLYSIILVIRKSVQSCLIIILYFLFFLLVGGELYFLYEKNN